MDAPNYIEFDNINNNSNVFDENNNFLHPNTFMNQNISDTLIRRRDSDVTVYSTSSECERILNKNNCDIVCTEAKSLVFEGGKQQITIIQNPIPSCSTIEKEKKDYTATPEQFWWTKQRIFIVIICILILMMMTSIRAYNSVKDFVPDKSNNNSTIPKIIPKTEWNGQLPRRNNLDLSLPVAYVIIAHTGNASCNTEEECKRIVFLEQVDHIQSSMVDIKYNFLVGGDGSIYVGRDWLKENEQFNSHYSKNSILIAFIGNFNVNVPTQRQLKAVKMFIEYGVHIKKIKNDYRLYGERQLDPKSDSPGSALYRIIRKWNHFCDIV